MDRTPVLAMSPEKMNALKNPNTHERRDSDVRAKIMHFSSLASQNNSPTRSSAPSSPLRKNQLLADHLEPDYFGPEDDPNEFANEVVLFRTPTPTQEFDLEDLEDDPNEFANEVVLFKTPPSNEGDVWPKWRVGFEDSPIRKDASPPRTTSAMHRRSKSSPSKKSQNILPPVTMASTLTGSNEDMSERSPEKRVRLRCEESYAKELAKKHAMLDSVNSQYQQSRSRERLVAERCESLMEQLHAQQTRNKQERLFYEKEIKTCKKNEYKAELNVLSVQEDIRELREENEAMKIRVEKWTKDKERAEQESFERAYALAGLTEEMQALKDEVKAAKQDRDAKAAEVAARDAAMDELEAAKESIRVNAMEELNATKEKLAAVEQERDEAAHKLAENARVNEEMEVLKAKVETIEQERQAHEAVDTEMQGLREKLQAAEEERNATSDWAAEQMQVLQKRIKNLERERARWEAQEAARLEEANSKAQAEEDARIQAQNIPRQEPEAGTQIRPVSMVQSAYAHMTKEDIKNLPDSERFGAILSKIVGEYDENAPDYELPTAPVDLEEYKEMQIEAKWATDEIQRLNDLVDFLRMQCQFKACACRQAEKEGKRYIHDHAYDQKMRQQNKRKAEDDLPPQESDLVRYQKLQNAHRAKRVRSEAGPLTGAVEQTVGVADISDVAVDANVTACHESEKTVDQKGEESEDLTIRAEALTLPPSSISGVVSIEEAAEIPLPSPRSDDPEPTALLEDMTQVMINPEPMSTTKAFSFSTSTASRHASHASQTSQASQSTIESKTTATSSTSYAAFDDIFDLAPPQSDAPRSPIRLVPGSPQTIHVDAQLTRSPSGSPIQSARTIQIPLKEPLSPLKTVTNLSDVTPRPDQKQRAASVLHQSTPGRTPLHFKHEKSSTISIPINDENSPPLLNVPGTPITREAALAQIRARRDRARRERDISLRSMP